VKRIENFTKNPILCHINTGNAKPISWSSPIKSLQDRLEFQKLVDELEQKGIVEESVSLWLNPVVLVRKKNGKLRFCVDFRRLNELVELDSYQIPKISEITGMLRDQKYFSTIDLKDGFFQVPIAPGDREKTTFFTGKKLMQFKNMPQGYKNSLAIIQRFMNIVLKDLLGTCCLVYIDDVLVYGKTKEEHDKNFAEL
jgi:hypothetical protein